MALPRIVVIPLVAVSALIGCLEAPPASGGRDAGRTVVELPPDELTVDATDSTTDSAELSLDGDPETRWASSPDELPRYLVYRAASPYLIAGIKAEGGGWNPCAQAEVYVSSDGASWGDAIARYGADAMLPDGEAATFDGAVTGQYLKLVVIDGANPTYCYIAEFRLLVSLLNG
ncbi:MAG TPA: discoidin domain-containing protein [Kofleriaceae bacterium]|nr:discoidin domain-containing protein [Kofleriaceae bacterium]